MAVFHPITNPRKRKRQLFLAWFSVIAGAFMLLTPVFFNISKTRTVFYTVLGINGIISGIGALGSRKPRFISIDETEISWMVYEKTDTVVNIAWEDIRWIKKETDGGITAYRESSFSNHCELKNFSPDDRQTIFSMISGYSESYSIRLINFSDPVLVEA